MQLTLLNRFHDRSEAQNINILQGNVGVGANSHCYIFLNEYKIEILYTIFDNQTCCLNILKLKSERLHSNTIVHLLLPHAQQYIGKTL